MGGVVHGDVEALAAESLVHGEAVPLGGDSGEDHQAFGGGTQAQDALDAAHHDGGGGAGQPMHMGTAGLGRLMALDELAVDVGLHLAQLGTVVVGRGAGLGEVLKRAAAVAQQGFGQDRPALGLAEDAAVLLGGGVEQLHQRAVEVVLLVAGAHDLNAPGGVELFIDGLHGGFGLLGGGQAGDDAPALGVHPHRRFGIVLGADDEAFLGVAAAEAVVLPEMLVDQLLLLLALLAQVLAVLGVFGGIGHQLVQHAGGVVQLHGDEGGFARSAQAQAVIPVGVQAGGHAVGTQMVHGEVNGALEVVQHGALVEVGVGDDFIQEILVAGLGDVLVHGGEEPQRVVGAVVRMAGGADIALVLGLVLVACIVVELHQGQAAAVMHLGAEHEHQTLLGHLGIEVDDALDILHGVAVAQAVALAAVDQGRRAAPHEGGEALEGVPGVDHGVEVGVGGVDHQAGQLAVPVLDQLSQLGVDHVLGVGIAVDDRAGQGGRLLHEKEGDGLALAGLQHQLGMQRAAGVAVEVEDIAQIAVLDSLGITEAVHAHELLAAAAVALHGCTGQGKHALTPVLALFVHAAELVDVLHDAVALEGGIGDELGILEVDQILLVVALGGQLAVGHGGDGAHLVRIVGDLHAPDLMGGVHGHIVQHLGLDARILALDLRVGGAVAGDGLVLIQGLFHRTPGGRPVVAVLVVPQVDIAAGLVELVEGVAQDTAVGAGLDEGIAAGILGHDSAVLRAAQVVRPGHGRTGVRDHVFPCCVVEIAILHGHFLLCVVLL